MPVYEELQAALENAQRSALYFIKQRNRQHDHFMCDEAKAEAIFIVTEILLADDKEHGKCYEAVLAKFPDPEERYKFYRMTVGYGLKAYFAYRRLSTLAYLKKKGVVTTQTQLEDSYVPRDDHAAMMRLMLDEAAKTPMEKLVLEYYMLGNEYSVISEKVGLKPKRVRRVMSRIKRRLKKVEV